MVTRTAFHLRADIVLGALYVSYTGRNSWGVIAAKVLRRRVLQNAHLSLSQLQHRRHERCTSVN